MASTECSNCKSRMQLDGDQGWCKRCASGEEILTRQIKNRKTGKKTSSVIDVPPPAVPPPAVPPPALDVPPPSSETPILLSETVASILKEQARQRQEQARQRQEQARQIQEQARQRQEQARQIQEQARQIQEQARQRQRHEKLAKDQEDFRRETEEKFAAQRASGSRKGVTAQAQFHDDLIKQQLLHTSRSIKIWDRPVDEWPLNEAVEVPENGTSEAGERGVQAIVSDALRKLNALDSNETKGWLSVPDPEAYKKASFRTRKPDIVNYKKGLTGSLAITSFGDLKKRGSGDFASDEVGHVLDMARTFMEHVGMYRPFLIVFLSDGKRWQFFRITRNAEKSGGYDYQQDQVIDDPMAGWKLYLALLTSDLSNIGYVEPAMVGVDLKAPLGRGGSAVVYEGVFENNAVLVKVFVEHMESSYEAEADALQVMKQVAGVPKLQACLQLTKAIKGLCGKAIVATPIGIGFAPREGACSVNGIHLKELVDIIQLSHLKQLLHRDIKPDNVYLFNGSMLLNDWSSAVMETSQPESWEGTIGFSVSPNDEAYGILQDGKVRDLISIVRTAYSLLFQEMPPSKEAEAIEYWRVRIRHGTHWMRAIEHAKNLEYEELGNLLEKMK